MEEHLSRPCCCPREAETCTSVSAQYADLSLPVSLIPFAVAGKVRTECCGEATVCIRPASGNGCGCELVITQSICMKVPIEYGATAEAGDVSVRCKPMCSPPCAGYRQPSY